MPHDWTLILTLVLCGGLGSLCRYTFGIYLAQLLGIGFPYGTLAVNVLGCLLLGFLGHYGHPSEMVSPRVRLAIGVGFLGGLTTFSTFAYETLLYIESGSRWMAATNLLSNIALGLLAVFVGSYLARVS